GARLADGLVADLLRRVAVFGFHLARLDLRQHSEVVAAATAEVLQVAGVEPDFLALDLPARARVLAREIANPRPIVRPLGGYSPQTAETIPLFQTIARLQQELRPDARNVFIVSMTAATAGVRAPLLLANEAGPVDLHAGRGLPTGGPPPAPRPGPRGRDRPGPESDRPREHGPAAGRPERPPAAHRAGRSGLRPLCPPRHRPSSARADDPRRV